MKVKIQDHSGVVEYGRKGCYITGTNALLPEAKDYDNSLALRITQVHVIRDVYIYIYIEREREIIYAY